MAEEIQKKKRFLNIPEEILCNTEFTSDQKIIFAEIVSLCRVTKQCWPSNEHLSELCGRHPATVSNMITELKKQGYITTYVDKKAGNKRYIYLKRLTKTGFYLPVICKEPHCNLQIAHRSLLRLFSKYTKTLFVKCLQISTATNTSISANNNTGNSSIISAGKVELSSEEIYELAEFEFYSIGINDRVQVKKFIELNSEKKWQLNKKNMNEKVKRYFEKMRDAEKTRTGKPNLNNPLIKKQQEQNNFRNAKKEVTDLIFKQKNDLADVEITIKETAWLTDEQKKEVCKYAGIEYQRFLREVEPDNEPLPF